jgi:2-(1,2-epoxy-1,2-dihydrophenyl)acetyl-CoA isomerase
MATTDLLVEKQDGVITITLNRPDSLNAIVTPMVKEFSRIVEEASRDDSIKVVVVTGAGRGFCSGADVTIRLGGLEKIEKTRNEIIAPIGSDFLVLRRCRKPTIAAVNGVAAGAGLTIALACDIRIGSDKARFTTAWVRRGMSAEDGVTYFLPRLLGAPKAIEFMITGDVIEAAEAERLGLLNRVVPHDKLMAEVHEFAKKIAKGPSVAIELTKMLAYEGLKNDLESQLAVESFAQNIVRQTSDFQEGVDSFKQKRPPEFKGR